jgi:hypothetical protein
MEKNCDIKLNNLTIFVSAFNSKSEYSRELEKKIGLKRTMTIGPLLPYDNYSIQRPERPASNILLRLKHSLKAVNALVIDEPESSLTIREQREVAKLIASIVNAGRKVVITTNSDILIKELNVLILLGNDFEGREDWLNKNEFYHSSDKLNFKTVSAYQVGDGSFTNLNVTNKGIEVPFFDDEINSLIGVISDLNDFIY